MNYFTALLTFSILSNALWAEDDPPVLANVIRPLMTLEQYEFVEKAPVGLVTSSREKNKWRFLMPCDYSIAGFGQKFEKVVLRGEGFEIPIGVRETWDKADRTEFTITDKMRESAVLEIWIRGWGNFGNYAAHYRITLSEITPKSEQVAADQPATAPDSKPEGKEKTKSESKGRSQ